jgi:hypothetical protein
LIDSILLFFQPRRADRLGTGSTLGAILSQLLVIAVFSLSLIVLATWVDMSIGKVHTLRQSFNRVFGDTQSALVFILIVAVNCVIASVIGALLYLADVHRAGRMASSFAVSWKLAISATWYLMAILLILGPLAISLDHNWGKPKPVLPIIVFCLVIGIPFTLLTVFIRWAHVAHLYADSIPPEEFDPICEGCGYGLQHAPASGICPECGRNVIDQNSSRPGSPWEQRAGPVTWLQTIASVIFQPDSFYRKLRLRTGFSAASHFARWTMLAMAIGAAEWAFWLFVSTSSDARDKAFMYLLPTFVAFAVPLAGLVTERAISAIALAPVFLRGALRDGRWAAKALRYETAFLWVFCAFDGLFFSSFKWFGAQWVTGLQARILGHKIWFFGIPQEPLLLFLGNGALCVIWLLRYRIIVRAIRWNNC